MPIIPRFEIYNDLVEIDLVDDERDEEKIRRCAKFYNHKDFFKAYEECEKRLRVFYNPHRTRKNIIHKMSSIKKKIGQRYRNIQNKAGRNNRKRIFRNKI